MRSLILILAALFALSAHAQTRFLVGADGGDSFNNYFLGIRASLEAPLGKHFEVDSSASFFPIENKPSYGKGVSYSLEPGATVWANTTSGFEGSFHRTGYTVTTVKKTEAFVFAGYVYKHTLVGFPTRRALRRYIPKFYYADRDTGIVVMELLNRVGKVPPSASEVLNRFIVDTFRPRYGADIGYDNLGFNGRGQIKILDWGCV